MAATLAGCTALVTGSTSGIGRAIALLLAQRGAQVVVHGRNGFICGGTLESDDVIFDEHINVNLRAPYILVQQLVPGMVERGQGAIVNISTLAATTPKHKGGIYGARWRPGPPIHAILNVTGGASSFAP